jgi:glycosyltransferase involved in cell wall biosynthesis
MKISVVVPTYKRPSLLAKCIDALYKQQFPKNEFDVIIVSDGQDEETEITLLELKDNNGASLRYYALERKSGPAAARNLGWRHASAPLVAFTDDDCIPDPDWLQAIYDLYVQQASVALIAFTGKTIVPIPEIPTDYEKNISHLSRAEFITANCAVTKEALTNVGGFDERFTMAWREDSDLQFKLMEQGIPLIKNENAIVTHPVRKAPWAVSLRDEKKGVFNSLLYKKYPGLYKQKIQTTPPWNYYFIILAFTVFIGGMIVPSKSIAVVGLLFWLGGTVTFIARRLRGTSKSWKHRSEMIVTSALIPFLSIYYRIKGAIKYRSPLIP